MAFKYCNTHINAGLAVVILSDEIVSALWTAAAVLKCVNSPELGS